MSRTATLVYWQEERAACSFMAALAYEEKRFVAALQWQEWAAYAHNGFLSIESE